MKFDGERSLYVFAFVRSGRDPEREGERKRDGFDRVFVRLRARAPGLPLTPFFSLESVE